MFQHFFSDYLVKLQETNHQWWHDFEVNKAVVELSFKQGYARSEL